MSPVPRDRPVLETSHARRRAAWPSSLASRARQVLPMVAVLLLSRSLAAIPVNLPYSGQLADGFPNSTLVNGVRDMSFELVNAGDVAVYASGTISVTVTNGAFSVVLGGPGTLPLDSSVFSELGLTLRVTIEGETLAPEVGLPFAPYAAGGDHSALQNLGADTHQQYLPRSGIRPMTGDLDLGGHKIDGASEVYVGTTDTMVGVLTVRGATALGSLTVADDATMEGDATVEGDVRVDGTVSVGSTTITSGVLMAPGTSALGDVTVSGGLTVEGGNNIAPEIPDGLRGTPLLTSLEGEAGVTVPSGRTLYVFYAFAPDGAETLQCGAAPIAGLAGAAPTSFPSPLIVPGGNTLRTASGRVIVSALEVLSSVQPLLVSGTYTVPAGKMLVVHSLTGFIGSPGSIAISPGGVFAEVGVGSHLNFSPPLMIPAGITIVVSGVITGTLR